MSVDIFGRSKLLSGNSNRVVSSGVTLTQANEIFLRLDGSNTVTENINMNAKSLTNVSDPVEAQDAVTKQYMERFTTSRDSYKDMLKGSGTHVRFTPIWTCSISEIDLVDNIRIMV